MSIDPYRYLNSPANVVTLAAREIYRATRSSMAHVWLGRGRDRTGEHVTGRALDVIISSAVGVRATGTRKVNGDKLANWLVQNAKKWHIRQIIWFGRIYRTRYGNWGKLPGRDRNSSVSDWHYDHIHILFEDTKGDINPGDLVPLSSTPVATPNSARTVRPFAIANLWWAIRSRRYDGNTTTVQGLLKKAGYYKGAIDGYFGPETVKAYAAWQRANGHKGPNFGTPDRVTLALLLKPAGYYVQG